MRARKVNEDIVQRWEEKRDPESWESFATEFEEEYEGDIDWEGETITGYATLNHEITFNIEMVYNFGSKSVFATFECDDRRDLEDAIERGDACRYDQGGDYGEASDVKTPGQLANIFDNPKSIAF